VSLTKFYQHHQSYQLNDIEGDKLQVEKEMTQA